MTTMIERVARTIADADMEDYMEFAHRYDASARAAIEAMRVPTMRMVTAASEVVVAYDDFACGDGVIYLSAEAAPSVWNAMIDAALNEKEST